VVQPAAKPQSIVSEAEAPAASMIARRRAVRREVRVQPRRSAVALAPRRQQVAERIPSPRVVSRTASPDRTGSLGTKPSSDSQMVKEPADPQAYMMAFVEKVRGKARPEPALQKPREP
jgi:hypothetical protein